MAASSPTPTCACNQAETAISVLFDTWRRAYGAADFEYESIRRIEDEMFVHPCAGPLDVLALVAVEFRLGGAADTPYQARIAAEAMRILGHE